MSRTDDCQAGLWRAVPQPMRKVKVSRTQGVIRPREVQTARTAETASMKA
jgi:hypothetical protein